MRPVTQQSWSDSRSDLYMNDAWLESLRSDARKALIRRLTMERVENGGLEGSPKTQLIPDSIWKLVESFGIGVAVVLVGTWLVHRSGIGKPKRKGR